MPDVLIEREDGLAILTFNRPERLNAIGGTMLPELAEAVPALVADPALRAIMITGAGRAFCAGGDITSMGGGGGNVREGMTAAHAWVKALRGCEKLVVTAVNGAAAGGGFGLAMLGDIVLASRKAFFKAGFTDLGVAADYGLGWTLPRAIGDVRAAEILFSDRRVAAEEALRLGFVARVIEEAAFAEEARAFARKLAGAPRGAQITKRLLRLSEREAFATYLAAEAEGQAEAFQTEDFREGARAFLEKRPAVFTGR